VVGRCILGADDVAIDARRIDRTIGPSEEGSGGSWRRALCPFERGAPSGVSGVVGGRGGKKPCCCPPGVGSSCTCSGQQGVRLAEKARCWQRCETGRAAELQSKRPVLVQKKKEECARVEQRKREGGRQGLRVLSKHGQANQCNLDVYFARAM
jgi:hypothetical protein